MERIMEKSVIKRKLTKERRNGFVQQDEALNLRIQTANIYLIKVFLFYFLFLQMESAVSFLFEQQTLYFDTDACSQLMNLRADFDFSSET